MLSKLKICWCSPRAGSFHDDRRSHVQTHNLQSQSLLIDLAGLLSGWSLVQAAQNRLSPLLVVAHPPQTRHWPVTPFQGFLHFWFVQVLSQVFGEDHLESPVLNDHCTEVKADFQRLPLLGKVSDRLPDSVVGGIDQVLVEVSGRGDGDWVAEHHPEALLVDRVLALRFAQQVFLLVPRQCIHEASLWNEHGLQPIEMPALFPLLLDVSLCRVEEGTQAMGDPWQLGLYFKSEGSEVPDIDAPALVDVFLEILDSGFPNQHHLTERLQRLAGRR